jgi:hypothetical protein
MILQTEKQLKAIKQILPENRIIHVDSTGELINIPNNMKPYSQIMNYVMLVKDKLIVQVF